jgi:hypothetical protein
MKNYYLFYLLFFHSALFSQYCSTGGPTSGVDSNVQTVSLIGESGAINYTGCPGVIGVQNLTNLGTTLNAGNAYTSQIKFGTCGGNYNGAGQAWIDFDQSGSFDASESIGTWSGIPPVAISIFNFTVPNGAQNGITRMRVIQQEGGTLPLNPCASFSWGSVMDFSITITNGVDCSGFIGDDINDPIIVSSLPYSTTGDNSYCYSNQNPVYSSPDVYYRLLPNPLMESVSVSLCGSLFDTFLSVIDANGNILAFNDDAAECGSQSSLTFNTDGIGIVYIIVEGWDNQMGNYSILIEGNYLSTEELNFQNSVLFPNPTTDFIQLKNIFGAIEILDASGTKIISVPDYAGEQIDLENYSRGLYFVKYAKDQKHYSEKFILN